MGDTYIETEYTPYNLRSLVNLADGYDWGVIVLSERGGFILRSALILLFFISKIMMAKPALDLRIEKGMQASPKIKTSATIDANIKRKVKEEAKEEVLTKLRKNKEEADVLWETFHLTALLYPVDSTPFSLGLRFITLPATRSLAQATVVNFNLTERRIDFGFQWGDASRKGIFAGIYTNIYEEFGFPDSTEKESDLSDLKVSTDFQTITVAAEVGIKTPLVGYIYGMSSAGVGYYKELSAVIVEGNDTRTLKTEAHHITLTFLIGIGFLVNGKEEI